jgi:hypothetical protein
MHVRNEKNPPAEEAEKLEWATRALGFTYSSHYINSRAWQLSAHFYIVSLHAHRHRHGSSPSEG